MEMENHILINYKTKRKIPMKLSSLIISFSVFLSTTSLAYAGPSNDPSHGHEHSHGHSHAAPAKLDDAGIINAASKGVAAIVKQKQAVEGKELSQSWSGIPDAAKSISKKGRGYSIVKFEDKEAKQNLYVLLSDSGEIYDANFSGTFPNLKE